MKSSILRRPIGFALSVVLAAAQTLALASAAEIVVDPPWDGGTLARNLYSPGTNRTSLVQTFRAEDERIRFGFRLMAIPVVDRDFQDPWEGTALTYRLYEGENRNRLIAVRYVAMPHEYSNSHPWHEDVGFVDADFSQVRLKVGAKYSMEISQEPNDRIGIDAYIAEENPYPYGGMYSPPAETFDPGRPWDTHFRMTPVAMSPCARTAALKRWIARAPGISTRDRKVLNNKLQKTLLRPSLPAYQRVACSQLNSFLKYIDQHSNRFDNATAVYLFDQVELIKKGIPCR